MPLRWAGVIGVLTMTALAFIMIHVGYEFEGKSHAGPWTNHTGGDTCTSCHDPSSTNHSFSAEDSSGSTFSTGSFPAARIRLLIDAWI